MYKRILIPLDGSTAANQALQPAETLAKAMDAKILLLRVVPSLKLAAPFIELPLQTKAAEADQKRQADNTLKWAKTLINDDALLEKTEVLSGSVAETIIAYAKAEGVDLILISSHGHGRVGRWQYGSIAAKILRGAHCDTLMVRGDSADEKEIRFRQILLPLDGSELAEQTLVPAAMFEEALGAETTLMGIMPPVQQFLDSEQDTETMVIKFGLQIERYLKQVRNKWRGNQADVTIRVKTGAVAKSILDYAREINIDLIIMASHGASGGQQWALGGVTDKVLRDAQRSVLIVRTNKEI